MCRLYQYTTDRGRKMKAEGEWERFTCSGQISDYLEFKRRETLESAAERAGEQMYAGFRDSDWNGDQNDTCR